MSNGLKRKIFVCGLFFAIFITACSGAFTSISENVPGQQQVMSYSGTVKSAVGTKYLLFLPGDYGKIDYKWPVIVYLHGASVRGNNINKIKRCGLPWVVEHEKNFPFIVISPQCKSGKNWLDADKIIALLDEVSSQYSVDTERVYATGLSLGGHGTWNLAQKYPDRFAAIAPLCGRNDTTWAENLKDMPVWVFHGDRDRVCPFKYSKNMVDALKKLGNDPKFTVYHGSGHDIVTRTYSNEELYMWFLSHRKVIAPPIDQPSVEY